MGLVLVRRPSIPKREEKEKSGRGEEGGMRAAGGGADAAFFDLRNVRWCCIVLHLAFCCIQACLAARPRLDDSMGAMDDPRHCRRGLFVFRRLNWAVGA